MQRWSSLALGALVVVALAALIVAKGAFRDESHSQTPLSGSPAASSAPGASAAPSAGSGAAGAGATTGSFDDLVLAGASPAFADPAGSAPALPTDAPKSVRFGVVLIQYGGAQGSPPGTRPKDEALRLAQGLVAIAKSDFRAAVAKGDPGSIEDAGRMPRGVLEPATEYTLFTLAKGDVSGPIDTPRGYWIVRRIE